MDISYHYTQFKTINDQCGVMQMNDMVKKNVCLLSDSCKAKQMKRITKKI